jgi:small subunit ribosomal protein S8
MPEVAMPSSKLKASVAKVLEDEGYISGFSVSEEIKPTLTVALKYFDGKPVIEEISRTSKPSLRVYMGSNDLPKVRSGLGIAIISTSQGVMTDRAARTAGIGGEVLCTVF